MEIGGRYPLGALWPCAPSTTSPSHSTRDPRHICATPGSKNGRTTMTTSDRSELLPLRLPSAITPTSTLITHSLLLLLIPSLLPHTATKSTQAEHTKPRPAPARPPTAHHSCNALRCCCPRRSRRRPRSGVGCCCSCFVFGTDDESPRILYAYLNYARKEAPASAPTPTPQNSQHPRMLPCFVYTIYIRTVDI